MAESHSTEASVVPFFPKPRLTYAEFIEIRSTPASNEVARLTVAALIERYIADMSLPQMKPLGASHAYTLRVMARMPIGAKGAAALKKHDVLDMVKALRTKVAASTAGQYTVFLSGVL